MTAVASSSGDRASDVSEQVLGVLTRYVSAPTARSIVEIARRRGNITTARLERAQLAGALEVFESGLRLFIANPAQLAQCRKDLAELARVNDAPEAVTVPIRVEEDIARARSLARETAVRLGFTLVGQTRLVTAVSELARNIVQYAGEGSLEFTATTTTPKCLHIVAQDKGPGIPNLDQILTGTYRSKLGMGLGLRGVKQLAERFEVQTAPGRGTTVRFTMRVA